MKPSFPLQFPKATKPTSLHGAPVRSNPSSAQFPEPTIGADRTGLLRRGFTLRPVSRGNDQPLHRFPGGGSAAPTRFPEAEQHIPPHRPPVHVELASPLRLPGSMVRALRHGLLERVMPALFTRLPERRNTSLTARGPRLKTMSSHDFPCAHTVLEARLPMLGGTHFAWLPTRSVSSARSHLRVERVAVRRSHRPVARPMRCRKR
jgi:hypothetical protein